MLTAYILINTESGAERSILDRLKRLPQVRESNAVLGSYDVFAKVECYDMLELNRVVALIRTIEGVKATNTLTVFQPAMLLRKVNAVILLVSDMSRSKEFYGSVMGLKLKFESPDWVEFLKDGAVLALHPTKIRVSNEGIMLRFITSDLKHVRERLRSMNVRFHTDVQEDGRGKYMVVEDPDGYRIAIVEPKVKEEAPAAGYYGFAPV
ncbi:MAG: Lrp/AsnC ligand binding domain-containing protein [Candidatus Nitrosocaldus sp.]|nr:Lrp/AsnC ligand binding domain-containing protein [Candidatus Nitrosocaldus sp.]MCS7141313.1 Lrp/AsnC ligand binding domain-containing protein [Candidatus Nitrosocaldus sp.]MDW8000278.1 Lrp/AsnC ligand binding domain-containing protein [Candidatus Nitrosocaldus sp.]MDW8274955.1 Lrp/AsnC ligand binding domain-containing protein [Candidatus Nitrosocaldus sp.]